MVNYNTSKIGGKMIYNYPYFGFPNYYGQVNNTIKHSSNNCANYNTSFNNCPPYSSIKKNSTASYKNETSYYENKEKKETSQSPFLTLLGIPFYFDDILLICVILFLYSEDIDDSYLMLVLLLLLMS
jgi:hypothetical protein